MEVERCDYKPQGLLRIAPEGSVRAEGMRISIEHQTTLHTRTDTFLQVFGWPFFETTAANLARIIKRDTAHTLAATRDRVAVN